MPDERQPANAIPLISFEGSAYDCGAQYADWVQRHHPTYRRYLDITLEWKTLSNPVRALFAKRAPFLLDLYRGLLDNSDPEIKNRKSKIENSANGCTSFALASNLTADRRPRSGQTKDTPIDRQSLYIILRLRITAGPSILVLAYPGEILGYGFWSTGMSLFRNDLNSAPNTDGKLTMVQWGLLALAGNSVEQAAELAIEHGILDAGNCLLADSAGHSLCVEFNAGGVSIIPATGDMSIHTNHPCGIQTAPAENYPDPVDKAHSWYRSARLRAMLEDQRGHATDQSIFNALADHGEHGRGVCRHAAESTTGIVTTAAVIADPSAGVLQVVRGQPCRNFPANYSL